MRVAQLTHFESPSEWEFVFGVKYYPTDPAYLKEEITKYQLCLQIRDDLMNGRLSCPFDTLVTLSSYWLQSEFGDSEEQSTEVKEYLSSLKYISVEQKPDPEFEQKVENLYKLRRGMPAEDADTQFLRLASGLPLYGLHRYSVSKDEKEKLELGIGSSGIFELKYKKNPVKYKWNAIKNINYGQEKFYVKLLTSEKGKHSLKQVYHLNSHHNAKALWKEAVDQHVFFRVSLSDKSTLDRTSSAKKKKEKKIETRKRKLSFGFSFRKKRQKTEAEVREESSKIKRPNPTVVRNPSLRRDEINKPKPEIITSSNDEKKSEKSEESPVIKLSALVHIDDESFEKENIQTDETAVKEPIFTAKPLLLTETIPEENEHEDNLDQTLKPELSNHTKIDCELNFASSKKEPTSQKDSQNIFTSTIAKDSPSIQPVLTVQMCPDSQKPTVDNLRKTVHPNTLTPPLLSQRTRDAIKSYFDQETKDLKDEDQMISREKEIVKEEQVEISIIVNDAELEVKSSTADTSKNSSQADREFFRNEDDDDWQTVGGFSHVAVLGDDDATIKDLIDDVTNGELQEIEKELEEESEINFTESTESSISNLSDNTDTLCDPNIFENIWTKCISKNKLDHTEISEVKLRKIHGKRRQIRSLESLEYNSVGIQVPSPTPTSGNVFGAKKRNFIPSWPFISYFAVISELDELDKEAIKAAITAELQLNNENLNEFPSEKNFSSCISSSLDINPVKKEDFIQKEATKGDLGEFQKYTDYIPGIPEFVKSVINNDDAPKNAFQQFSHVQSESKREKVITETKLTKHFPVISSLHPEKTEIDAFTFKPISTEQQIDTNKSMKQASTVEPQSISNKTDYEHQNLENLTRQTIQEKKEFNVEKHQSDKNSVNCQQGANLDKRNSGRSTPSSVSSFPTFIHSVYPLRQISSNMSDAPTDIQQDETSDKLCSKSSHNEDTSEFSLSNCSVISVKGSSSESSNERLEEFDFQESNSFCECSSTSEILIKLENEVRLSTSENSIKINNKEHPKVAGQSDFEFSSSKTSDKKDEDQADEYSDDFTDSVSIATSTKETELELDSHCAKQASQNSEEESVSSSSKSNSNGDIFELLNKKETKQSCDDNDESSVTSSDSNKSIEFEFELSVDGDSS